MTLLDVRKQFVTQSGRYDLVVDTVAYVDNGADYFIKEGQRFLDRRATHLFQESTAYTQLSANGYILLVTKARSIRDVSIFVDTKYVELDRLQQTEFFRTIAVTLGHDAISNPNIVASITPRTPTHYTVVNLRDFPDVTADQARTSVGILLNCPVLADSMIQVKFLTYSLELTNNTDQNFWTEHAPQTLIQAALYTLERGYRNREGMADHIESIDEDLRMLDFDLVDQEVNNVTQMKNSW